MSQITSSPYSIFGLGIIEGNSIGTSKAMGGTGIALMPGQSVNLLNPASYGGIDSLYTIFELGIFGKYTSFSNGNYSQSLTDANIKYFVMSFRVNPRVVTSFGVTPYSTVGYKINTLSSLEGSNQEISKTFSGKGGVNQFYIGGSYKITKNLFLGINAIYIFGTITHSESIESIYYSLENLTYLSNFEINYGLNYSISKNGWKYNVGLTYDNGKALNTKNISTIFAAYESEVITSYNNKLKIPQTVGLGLAFEKGYFKLGIDYKTQKWSDCDFKNPLLETRNSNRYSCGIEFPSLGIRKGTSGMMFYRFGAEYNGSYLVIDGNPIDYRAISFGAGFPVKGILSVINLSVELGQNGTNKNGLIKENFCTFHIDVALKDRWFMKIKYM